jgi:hypothetical protein
VIAFLGLASFVLVRAFRRQRLPAVPAGAQA